MWTRLYSLVAINSWSFMIGHSLPNYPIMILYNISDLTLQCISCLFPIIRIETKYIKLISKFDCTRKSFVICWMQDHYLWILGFQVNHWDARYYGLSGGIQFVPEYIWRLETVWGGFLVCESYLSILTPVLWEVRAERRLDGVSGHGLSL